MASRPFYIQTLSWNNWQSYQLIRKKAVEQELSWSGFIVSMSIAFFLVIVCSLSLRMVAQSLEAHHPSSMPASLERVHDFSNIV